MSSLECPHTVSLSIHEIIGFNSEYLIFYQDSLLASNLVVIFGQNGGIIN